VEKGYRFLEHMDNLVQKFRFNTLGSQHLLKSNHSYHRKIKTKCLYLHQQLMKVEKGKSEKLLQRVLQQIYYIMNPEE
jgi:hypothetical protein